MNGWAWILGAVVVGCALLRTPFWILRAWDRRQTRRRPSRRHGLTNSHLPKGGSK